MLLAPGRRYREQTPDGLRGCDGRRPWRIPEPDEDRDAHWIGGPEPPLRMLLCPAWLLRSSRLEVRGRVTACGRDALHVVATARAGIADAIRSTPLRAGQTQALVDPELGILLRVGGKPVRRYELRDVAATRAGDFRVDIPSGLRTEPEADRWASVRDADPRHQAVTPLKVAGVVAREVGKEAAKAARKFLRRLGSP